MALIERQGLDRLRDIVALRVLMTRGDQSDDL